MSDVERSPILALIRNTWINPAVVVAAVGLTTFPVISNAQDSAPAARVLDEVVVTARRLEESAQSVPIAVTALNADTLETFKIDSLDDLQYKAIPVFAMISRLWRLEALTGC